MNESKDQVQRVIRRIRQRWRRRAMKQGAAITTIVSLLLATALLLLYVTLQMPSWAYVTALFVSGAVVLGTGIQYIGRPAFRRIGDRQIALYVEEKIPDLEDRLNSAVEISGTDSLPEEEQLLIDRLIDDAARRAEHIPITTVVERGSERQLSYAVASVLGLFVIVGMFSFDDLRRAVSDVGQLRTALTESAITVRPGDIEVEQGSSQEIIADLREASEEPVVIHVKRGEGEWEQAEMQKGISEPSYLYELNNIQQGVEYTVEIGDHRAGPFRVSLYEFPEVQQIDVRYRYPAYSSRPVRTEENTGDIRGLVGSQVTISVTTAGSVVNAVMERENGSPITLERTQDNRFQASFSLESKDFYRIRLTDEKDKTNRFPQQYLIQPVEDEKPFISLSDPGRDIRANAIQEVLVAANVEDDFGVRDVRLRYSVNGQEEQSISLATADGNNDRQVTGEHLFFLEEYSLEPGDVISYYVEANDYAPSNTSEATDMYFIEVMPFDQRFSQVNNTGGGGGGGQPSGTVLSQQQIITATWKLYRQRDERPPEEFRNSVESLQQGQSNLRQNIEQRLNSTAFSTELQTSEKHQSIVESLRSAVDEMKAAQKLLAEGQLRDALTPERRALNHLLKAEAANQEQQLAMQRQGGSAGGGAAATEQRMSELMDLELDISQDKYEMQQRGGGSPQQQRSEALDRIRELAQKQEELLKQEPREVEGEDKKRFVDRLQREQRELQRQAQNLAQQMRKQARQRGERSGRMQEQLDRITEQMQQAGKSLRNQDVQSARTQQQQALQDLQRIRENLRMENTDDLRKQLEEFTNQFEQLRQREEAVGQDVRDAVERSRSNNGRVDRRQLDELSERQSSLSETASNLKEDAERLREQSSADERELSSKLENLVRRMEQTGLQENIRDSEEALDQGWLDYARRKQDDIDRSLDQLSTDMETFRDQLPQTQQEQLTRSLEEIRNLRDQMRQIQQQARDLRQSQSPTSARRDSQDLRAGRQPPSGNQQSEQTQPDQNESSQAAASTPEQQTRSSASAQQPSDGSSSPSRAQSRRLDQELQRAQQSIDELRRQMSDNQQVQRTLDGLESFLQRARADHTGVLLDEEGADAFFSQEIYSPLSDLELNLARQLDGLAMENKLHGARRGNVPSEYEQLVEKYYEQLSKSDDN